MRAIFVFVYFQILRGAETGGRLKGGEYIIFLLINDQMLKFANLQQSSFILMYDSYIHVYTFRTDHMIMRPLLKLKSLPKYLEVDLTIQARRCGTFFYFWRIQLSVYKEVADSLQAQPPSLPVEKLYRNSFLSSIWYFNGKF